MHVAVFPSYYFQWKEGHCAVQCLNTVCFNFPDLPSSATEPTGFQWPYTGFISINVASLKKHSLLLSIFCNSFHEGRTSWTNVLCPSNRVYINRILTFCSINFLTKKGVFLETTLPYSLAPGEGPRPLRPSGFLWSSQSEGGFSYATLLILTPLGGQSSGAGRPLEFLRHQEFRESTRTFIPKNMQIRTTRVLPPSPFSACHVLISRFWLVAGAVGKRGAIGSRRVWTWDASGPSRECLLPLSLTMASFRPEEHAAKSLNDTTAAQNGAFGPMKRKLQIRVFFFFFFFFNSFDAFCSEKPWKNRQTI